ncbi:hypothetical protein [Coleofasciculus sp. FACHB-501]|nr:hypothetical protein [Coleofasciculus sp. FACHB-501]
MSIFSLDVKVVEVKIAEVAIAQMSYLVFSTHLITTASALII